MPIRVTWDESLWETIKTDLPDEPSKAAYQKKSVPIKSFFDYERPEDQYQMPGVSSYPTYD